MRSTGEAADRPLSSSPTPPISNTPHVPVAAVVLAAGESSRLGAFKPLLPWPAAESAETLVAYQVRQLRQAGLAPVVVVTGSRADEVGAAAVGAEAVVAHNPQYPSGKASSVRTGVAATPEGLPLLIVGVDQPRPAWIYRRLVAACREGHDLVIPTYAGRRGHPPIFPAHLRAELLAVQEESFGLRAVVQRYAADVAHVEIASPLMLVNLNTPEELAAARQVMAAIVPSSPVLD